MPSNITLDAGDQLGADVTTKLRTHDGDPTQCQSITIAGVAGTEDSYTFEDIAGTAANGLDVDVTRVGGTVTISGAVTGPVTDTELRATPVPVSGTIATVTTVGTVTNITSLSGQAVDYSTGSVDTGTIRVTIADNDPVNDALVSMDAKLVTGTVIGDVNAVQSGTWTVDLGANNDVVCTLDAETTKVIGTVRMASGGVASGSFASGSIAAGAIVDLPLPADAATQTTLATIDTDTGNIATSTATSATPVATIGSTPLQRVAIYDGSDSQITTFGGGTQYAEGADGSAPLTGTQPVLVREDAPSSLQDDGDVVAQRATEYGAAYVQLLDSSGNFIDTFAGSGGTNEADEAAFSAGSTAGTPMMGATSSDTVVADKVGILAMTADRELKVDITSNTAGVGGGTAYIQNAGVTDPATAPTFLMARDDVLTTQETADDDWTVPRANARGAQWVALDKSGSIVDANNSSTANLGNGGVFTGTATDCQGYAAVCVNLFSDEDGASDGMTFQFCSNSSFGADADIYAFNMTADESRRFQFPVTARYFRVVYTNGTSTTTDLDIQTILHPTTPAYTSIHKIEDNVSVDRSAELVKSALIAQVNGTGDFVPVQANAGGVLKVGGSVDVDSGTIDTVTTVGTVTNITSLSGQAVDFAAGDIDTGTLRVTVAEDDDVNNALNEIAAAVDTQMQCDIVAELPAGTQNIGDVDVASSALPSGAATAAKQLADGHNVVVTSAPTTAVTGPVTDTELRAAPVPVTLATLPDTAAGDLAAIETATVATQTATGTISGAIGTEDGALGDGILIMGDDGTDLKHIAVDATTGNLQVDIAADGAGLATAANQLAKATGGMDYKILPMAAADNDTQIKSGSGTLYFISVQSIDATPVYLKLFNAASITPGTTAADMQFMCPSQGTALGSGIVLNFGDHGIYFDTGIYALIATGIALDDNTAVSANEVAVTIGYK